MKRPLSALLLLDVPVLHEIRFAMEKQRQLLTSLESVKGGVVGVPDELDSVFTHTYKVFGQLAASSVID